MKDAGIFWGCEKNRDFFCELKSTITEAQFTAGVGFLCMLKTQGFFLGRQILKVGVKYEPLLDPSPPPIYNIY